MLRRFRSDGTPVGAASTVPTSFANPIPNDGLRYLLVWTEEASPTDFTVYAQRFTSARNLPSAGPAVLVALAALLLAGGARALRLSRAAR